MSNGFDRLPVGEPRPALGMLGPSGCLLAGLRLLIAWPVALLTLAVATVLVDGLLGLDPSASNSDREIGAIFLASLLIGAWLWRWLGRRGPLRNLPSELTTSEALAARTVSVVAALWGCARLMLFGFATLVMLIAWYLIANVLGIEIEAGETARSNQQFIALLLLSILSTALLWRREIRRRRELAAARGEARLEPAPEVLLETDALAPDDDSPVEPVPLLDDAVADLPAVSILTEPSDPYPVEPAAASKPGLDPQDVVGTLLPLDETIFDALDTRQRRALWALSENGSATASELAETLDMRLARVPGFMNGLDRQLAALGHRCFRSETLPSGEPHYIYRPRELNS